MGDASLLSGVNLKIKLDFLLKFLHIVLSILETELVRLEKVNSFTL